MIGNRYEMHKHGHTLFETLILAYLKLKDSGLVIRGIQPSTTYISQDAKKVQFCDLMAMTKEN